MESKTPVKDRLTKKSKKRGNPHKDDSQADESNIFEMLGKVNAILKQNPEMLTKVNKCVSNIIDNKDLMEKLSSQIQENIKLNDPSDTLTPDNITDFSEIIKDDVIQALNNNELDDSLIAESNESIQ